MAESDSEKEIMVLRLMLQTIEDWSAELDSIGFLSINDLERDN